MKKHNAPAKKDFTNLKKFIQDDRSHKLANIIAYLQFSQHVSQTLQQRLQKKHASQTERTRTMQKYSTWIQFSCEPL